MNKQEKAREYLDSLNKSQFDIADIQAAYLSGWEESEKESKVDWDEIENTLKNSSSLREAITKLVTKFK